MGTDRRTGVIIGRFMPPHAGHAYLIRFARAYAGDLTVFVCTLRSEPIPGELRFAWMQRLFPDVSLVHVTEEIPQASREHEGAFRIWADAIRARLDHDPRYVFASEEYGARLATELGAQFVPVDPQRSVFPVSAGMIRERPFANWRYIPPPVRPFFARKIVVIDSSGRLVPELAGRFDTSFATDYAAYSRALGRSPRPAADLARAQAASEAALLESANRILFTPTDAARILTDAGLPAAERREHLTELEASFPSLAPAVIVATEPIAEEYRRTTREIGWRLVELTTSGGKDAAREEIEALAATLIEK